MPCWNAWPSSAIVIRAKQAIISWLPDWTLARPIQTYTVLFYSKHEQQILHKTPLCRTENTAGRDAAWPRQDTVPTSSMDFLWDDQKHELSLWRFDFYLLNPWRFQWAVLIISLASLLRALICGPLKTNTHGTRVNTRPIPPSKLEAPGKSRARNIWEVNSGKTAPNVLRQKLWPAKAELAYRW